MSDDNSQSWLFLSIHFLSVASKSFQVQKYD